MPDDPEERHIRAMIRSLQRAFEDGTAQTDLTRLAGAVMGDRDVEASNPDAEPEPPTTSLTVPLESTDR